MLNRVKSISLFFLIGLLSTASVFAQDDGDAIVKKWEKEVFTDDDMIYAVGKEEGMLQVARSMSVNSARVEMGNKVKDEQEKAADFLKDQFRTEPTKVSEVISNLKLETIELSNVSTVATECVEGDRPQRVVCYSAVKMPRKDVDERIDNIIQKSNEEVYAVWMQHRKNPF